MKHKCRFYPTGEKYEKKKTPLRPALIPKQGYSYDKPKTPPPEGKPKPTEYGIYRKFICECGDVKWVKEK